MGDEVRSEDASVGSDDVAVERGDVAGAEAPDAGSGWIGKFIGAVRRHSFALGMGLAVAAVLAIGTFVFGLGGTGKGGSASPTTSASPSASPGISPSVTPSPTLSPSHSPSPSESATSDGSMPPGSVSEHAGLPSAQPMTPGVWGAVGPGWSLVWYASATEDLSTETYVRDAKIVYLLSPNGARYQLLELPGWVQDDPLAWDPVARVAYTSWPESYSSVNSLRVDLATGELTSMSFPPEGTQLKSLSPPLVGNVYISQIDRPRELFHMEDGSFVATLLEPPEPESALPIVFPEGGRFLFLTGKTRNLLIFDLTSQQWSVVAQPVDGWLGAYAMIDLSHMLFVADGDRYFASGPTADDWIVDLENGTWTNAGALNPWPKWPNTRDWWLNVPAFTGATGASLDCHDRPVVQGSTVYTRAFTCGDESTAEYVSWTYGSSSYTTLVPAITIDDGASSDGLATTSSVAGWIVMR